MIILCDIKMRNYVNSTDIKFRLFLLNIFHAQEFTFYDIRNTVHRDYPTKTISDDRLKVLIKKMMGFGLLSRRRLEHRDETNCLYTYAITRQGHKRREYYREKLNQGWTDFSFFLKKYVYTGIYSYMHSAIYFKLIMALTFWRFQSASSRFEHEFLLQYSQTKPPFRRKNCHFASPF